MDVFSVIEGDSPIVLGQPHGGTYVPDLIFNRLNEMGKGLDDTDWHITQLYDGLLPGATVVHSNVHRYVIDANRDPSGVSLYPGKNTTALCPMTDFDSRPIWQENQEPQADEVLERRKLFHSPYHAALAEQLERVREKHGVAILYDCHSIRSTIPFLFEGVLPEFSIGTNSDQTCDPRITKITKTACQQAKGFAHVVNGRFKGGWTTRHYGRPEAGIHAIQMELAQRSYMDEQSPWSFNTVNAAVLRQHLTLILKQLDEFARSGAVFK